MRFLLIVLVIHLTVEVIGNAIKNRKNKKAMPGEDSTLHPAEFDIR